MVRVHADHAADLDARLDCRLSVPGDHCGKNLVDRPQAWRVHLGLDTDLEVGDAVLALGRDERRAEAREIVE